MMVSGRRWRAGLMVLVSVALAVLSCAIPGFGGEGGSSAGETDIGAEPVGDDDVPLTYTGLGTGDLGSYRSQMDMTFVGADDIGAPVEVRYAVDQAYSREQSASSFMIDSSGTGVPEGLGSIEFTQIGDTSYVISEGECLAFTDEAISPDDETITPDDVLAGADLSGAKRVLPNENINGIMTRHYRFTQDDVNVAALGLTNATGDIWVAVDGGFVVKQVVSADGSVATFGNAEGHLEWTYELLEINAPVSIDAPAGCESPDGDVPIMPDATEVSAITGLVTYSTVSPVADVVAFYENQMPAQGWAASTSSTDVPGLAALEYTRDSQTASILISEGDGQTDVLITVE